MEPLNGQKAQNVVNSGGGRSLVYKLPLGEAAATFNLQKAVCSHGFFMTAPNHWDPISKTLRRPLRLLHSLDRDGVSSSSSVTVQISQPPHSSHLLLRVFDTDSLSPAHQQSLMEQVRRMLRLSEEEEKTVREFQEIYCEAKASGFGRVFRPPTLFEDMVKCILVCNCQANRILGLAQSVVEGRIQLKQLEEDYGEASLTNYIKLNEQLGKINGFDPFTCANVLMCMGFYHVIPSDSETLRHLNQVHGKKSTMKSIQQDIEMIYAKYAPFQFLVYWSEIWSFYEERFGKLSELPNSDYKLITAVNMRCKDGICSRSKIL